MYFDGGRTSNLVVGYVLYGALTRRQRRRAGGGDRHLLFRPVGDVEPEGEDGEGDGQPVPQGRPRRLSR